ncbi:CLUMA_CG003184, isoform A [Clunio marinus]|uniref:CLUMA_CG003184, isoform A n=1 Tax=Clunio marinus TaxID=568069 RepID=A0A1J1HSI2_9DIPT|nr:CLUMA_CG003184, isoform A [Clunio marinus]
MASFYARYSVFSLSVEEEKKEARKKHNKKGNVWKGKLRLNILFVEEVEADLLHAGIRGKIKKWNRGVGGKRLFPSSRHNYNSLSHRNQNDAKGAQTQHEEGTTFMVLK